MKSKHAELLSSLKIALEARFRSLLKIVRHPGHDETKVSHLTQKKLAGIKSLLQNDMHPTHRDLYRGQNYKKNVHKHTLPAMHKSVWVATIRTVTPQ